MRTNRKRRMLLMGSAAVGWSVLTALIYAQPQERIIKVVAKRFDYTPREIQLKKGVPVVLELSSMDVIMGFNAPDFGVRSDVVPGTVSRVRFTPDKVGTFPFHCDIFCGSGHEQMAGLLTIT